MAETPLPRPCLWSHLYERQGLVPEHPHVPGTCAAFSRVLGTEQPVPGEDTSRPGQKRCWSR